MQKTIDHILPLPRWLHITIAALLVILLIAPFFEWEASSQFIIAFLLFAGLTVLTIRYKQTVLFGLAALVPLSISAPIAGSAKISLPAELLCLSLSMFFLVKLLLGAKIKRNFVFHPISIILLIDILWLLITSSTSGMPEVSFKRTAIRIIYIVGFYYWTHELFSINPNNYKRLVLLISGGMLIPILYTIYRHSQLRFMMVGSQQLSAPFYFDHTIYGAALVFFVPYLIFLFTKSSKYRLQLFLLLLVFLTAIYLSYSRAAWLSLMIALMLYVSLHVNIRLRYFFVVLLGVAAFSLYNIFQPGGSAGSTKDQSHSNDIGMHLKSVSNVSTDASNKERINRWKCALRMFADKPVFGFGPGTYQFYYGTYQVRTELTRISTFTGNKGHAHSEYLNYLSETGLPGLLIFCALLFTTYRTALKLIKKGSAYRNEAIAIICCLTTFYIHAFFNGFLEFDKIALPAFSSMAALTAFSINEKASCT